MIIPIPVYDNMALRDNEAKGLRWSQKEIAETIGASQQVIAYHLKKLREQSKEKGVDDVFSILGGMAVGAGIGALAMLLEQLTKK